MGVDLRRWKRIGCCFVFAIASFTTARAQTAKQPFTVETLLQIARISEPVLSPDGKQIAFTVQRIDLENNSKDSQVYVIPVDGGAPKQLTTEGHTNKTPRWSPDSKQIYFVSDRNGSSQVWMANADGSVQMQVTQVPTEADDEMLSPDGKYLLFKSDVYPNCSTGGKYDAACEQQKLDADAHSKMHARVYTALLYRHWTEYAGNKRSHLLIEALQGDKTVRDLTPGDHDVPPFSLGGPEAYAFSPDSKEVAYTANLDPIPANSTNSDLFVVPVEGGDAKKLTSNMGADEGPLYSPDGKYIAYRTQARAGFESDQWKLAVIERSTGASTTLTDSLDRWVESYTWSPDSKRIAFTADDHGTQPIFMISAVGGPVRTIAQGAATISDVQFTPDDKTMIYVEQSGSRPAEIYRASSHDRSATPLTHINDALLDSVALQPLKSFQVTSGDGTKVQSFYVEPPNFDPSHKYPVMFQFHGGPQGDWGESWTYRWNAQVFASAGYVVVLPNPHGSNGYGQAFTDEVSGDWGGRPYDDIMATVDYVATQPWADPGKFVAAGGSYGGYMIDWILGHTTRFKALVSHAGVYDLRSEAGTTEELWFPKWEFQGFPWENPELYAKWSPDMFVKNFKTPTLVTHGELDYRVPIGQGQELFTALQEMNVPSKLIQFPDEGHWILKPQNSQFWYHSVIDWFNQNLNGPTAPPPAATAPGEPK